MMAIPSQTVDHKIKSDIFYSPSMIIIIRRMEKKHTIITLTFVKKTLCFELRLLNAVGAKIPLFSNEIQNILQNTYY